MHIRSYRSGDLPALYDICLRTGDSGEDATGQFADPKLIGEIFAAPYAAHDPGLISVATDDDGVAGYVIGCLDTLAFEDWCEREWWPPLRKRYPEPADDDTSRDARMIRMIHAPVPTHPRPYLEVPATHPSHLHIDLLPRAQGHGVGRRLIERLLDQLTALGSPGVHLGVSARNHRAIGFYERLGFTRLVEPPTDRPPAGYTLGMKLPR
ncbi:GNAT family N-acetyltransferase [Phytoactinopolyspora halotolerans]|uniref:GNAT family N-acetyltransferase n=1 Tax=Phytoactinopolyspora halotolerans TaxID=1981512 RepID=A0A6L9S2Q8_9ACTN|nr:GNAT family N-acetyltransferase [Phytoactinopolyspora halotolerans]NED98821.1 GNAT family N-acetyltransferase [Phytoactinopolyspora halotolerans]